METEQHQLVRKYTKGIFRIFCVPYKMRFSIILYHRCKCGKCEVMPTAKESICCREILAIDNKLQESSGGNLCCITEHEGFQPVCLDVSVLQTAGFHTQQEFGRHVTSGRVLH